MKLFEIIIDGESTTFTTRDYYWVKYEGFLLEEPFRYSNATKNEKEITDSISTQLNLCVDSDSIICISELEELPYINIETKD